MQNCRKIKKEYEPLKGIPQGIYAHSFSFPHSVEVQRIESFIYYNGVVHLPRRGSRLNGTAFTQLKALKISAGHWERVKESVSFPKSEHWINAPEAFRLAKGYCQHIIESEALPRLKFRGSGQRQYPRKPRKPSGIRDDIAGYLREGTGLYSHHTRFWELIEAAEDYEAYTKALNSWRYISIIQPRKEIYTQWSVSPLCGRIYCKAPALQQISSEQRLICLEGAEGKVSELDFTGCHLNLMRSLSGIPPSPDPWEDMREGLSLYNLSRQETKRIVIPILYGRQKGMFCKVNGSTVTNPAGLFDSITGLMPGQHSAHEIMELESRVLLDVLLRMKEKGLPSGLSIHDSLLTEYPEEVLPIMQEVSKDITGYSQPLSVKA